MLVLVLMQALVSVSTVGTYDELSDAQLEAQARQQLAGWFGASEVATWQHLRTYRIPFAQPSQVGWGARQGPGGGSQGGRARPCTPYAGGRLVRVHVCATCGRCKACLEVPSAPVHAKPQPLINPGLARS